MVLWNDGTMVLWNFEIMELWNHDRSLPHIAFRYLQANMNCSKSLVCDKVVFRDLLLQIVKDVCPDQTHGFNQDAYLLLQQTAEKFLIEMFERGNDNSNRWERDTLLPRDIIIGCMELNFDYIQLSQREKPKSMMKLLSIYKK